MEGLLGRLVGKSLWQGKGFFEAGVKCYEEFARCRGFFCDALADHMCERSREDSGRRLSMLVQNLSSMFRRLGKKVLDPGHRTRVLLRCGRTVGALLAKAMLADFELVLETLGNQFKLWRLIKEKENQMDSILLNESHNVDLNAFENCCSNDVATQLYDLFLEQFARLEDLRLKANPQKASQKRTLPKFWLSGTVVSFPPQKAHASQVELFLKSNIQIWKGSLFEAYNNDLGLKRSLQASYRNLMSVHETLVSSA
jgi:hypothetical protein